MKTEDGYVELFSGEKHDFRSVQIPAGTPAVVQCLGDEDAYVLKLRVRASRRVASGTRRAPAAWRRWSRHPAEHLLDLLDTRRVAEMSFKAGP